MKIEDLSSTAKIKVFKILVRVNSPLCFREIVSLANIGIRSAQIALRDFERLELVKVKKHKHKVLYEIVESKLSKEYKRLFEEETKDEILKKAKIFSKEVKRTVDTLQGLYDFGKTIDDIRSRQ